MIKLVEEQNTYVPAKFDARGAISRRSAEWRRRKCPQAKFFDLSQSGERPETVGGIRRFEMMPSSPCGSRCASPE
jgi:hypothetical protein